METATVRCRLCGQPILPGDFILPVRTMPPPDADLAEVHLKCLRPLPRETLPLPPTLTDDDIG